MATQEDYDAGEVTDREQGAYDNQLEISKYSNNSQRDLARYNKSLARNVADWSMDRQSEIADRNAQRTTSNAEYNAANTGDQLKRSVQTYNFANRQNRALRDTQFKQASQKSEAERFNAQRNLRNAALGLLGSMMQHFLHDGNILQFGAGSSPSC